MDTPTAYLEGYEADTAILYKRQSDIRHITIVVVTSYALSGDEKRRGAAGCVATCRTKPTAPKNCFETINRYWQRFGRVSMEQKWQDPPRNRDRR